MSNPEEAAKAASKQWSHEETSALISIWANRSIQGKLEKGNNYWKKMAWNQITNEFRGFGYVATKAQVKGKLKRLREEYEKESAARPAGSEGDPPSFEFWDEMHPILSSRHSTEPPNTIDTLSSRGGDRRMDDFDQGRNLERMNEMERRKKNRSSRINDDDDDAISGTRQPAGRLKATTKKSRGETNLSFNPYRRRGKRGDPNVTEFGSIEFHAFQNVIDKAVSVMLDFEQKIADREERRDRQFLDFLKEMSTTQSNLMRELISVLRNPAHQTPTVPMNFSAPAPMSSAPPPGLPASTCYQFPATSGIGAPPSSKERGQDDRNPFY